LMPQFACSTMNGRNVAATISSQRSGHLRTSPLATLLSWILCCAATHHIRLLDGGGHETSASSLLSLFILSTPRNTGNIIARLLSSCNNVSHIPDSILTYYTRGDFYFISFHSRAVAYFSIIPFHCFPAFSIFLLLYFSDTIPFRSRSFIILSFQLF